jgi:hypothetical protein
VPPSRVALLGIALAAALLVGLAASFAASQILPTFHDARSLREVSMRPVLGTITMLPTDALMRGRRRSAFLFAGGFGGLLLTFATVLVVAGLVVRAA